MVAYRLSQPNLFQPTMKQISFLLYCHLVAYRLTQFNQLYDRKDSDLMNTLILYDEYQNTLNPY